MKNFFNFRLMNDLGIEGAMGSTNAEELGGDINETFDNLEYESDASKEAGKKFEDKFKDRIDRAKKAKDKSEEEDEKPKAKKEEKKESKKGSDLDMLDESDLEEKEEKAEKPKAKKEEKKEDKADEEEEGEKDESAEAKSEAKKLKIRMADGLYGIDSDAKVRVKVDGAFQEVPVQELINNYSGKVAYDKKFTEIGNEKKLVEQGKAEVAKSKEYLNATLTEIISNLDDPNKNPFDALYFLVEKSGRDIYSVYKRAVEANLDEVENLMSMSDVERENYFLKKQSEFRTKSEEARKAEATKNETFKQAVQKVDSLRQAHGISEEQYLQALDQLDSEGVDTKKLTDEQVVDYASLKPHVDAVQDVLEPYEDSIDDTKYSEIVRNLSRQLRAKDFTKEQLTEWARKEFMDEDVKDLQTRTKEVQKKSSKVEVKAPTKLETLDFGDED
jgi:Tfp pilus assembly protein PilE